MSCPAQLLRRKVAWRSLFAFTFVWRRNLNRKAHLSLSATASLAFRWPLTYPTPSVFHADQRGMINIWIRTLWPEFWSNPCPHGGPQHQQDQGKISEHTLSKIFCLAKTELVIGNFFLIPPDNWFELWGFPYPDGGPIAMAAIPVTNLGRMLIGIVLWHLLEAKPGDNTSNRS